MARKKLFLIDGHSHLYRAFFAVKGLTSPEGRPTNAVFGFTAMLRKLLREQKPDYLAVALDMPGKTFRHDLFEDYKATRVKPPDEFIAQIPLTREVLDALQVPVYALEGYEADDVLGTLAVQASGLGVDVVIVTGDKDAAQLLGPNVSCLDTGKDQTLTAEKLRERDGIAPEQVIEVMALSGDASDNVPGVPHVGPKTALELIREYGTLENVLAHVGEIRGKRLKESLTTHADAARLSRRLVTIDTKAPVELSLDACRVKPPEPERLVPVFQKLGFRQFIAEFPVAPTREEAAAYHLVDTEEALESLLAALRAQKRFSIDLETTSTSPMLAEIVGLSVCWQPKEAWYIPTRALAPDPTLDTEKVLDALRPILTDESVGKIGQNIKYDTVVLRRHGVELRGIVFDTMIAAYVLDAERRRYGLDELAADYLSYRMIPISDLIGKGKKQITMDRVPARKVCDYCCADSDIALRLSEILEKLLRDQKMHDLFAQVEMPLVSVLAEMEFQGIGLDVAALRTMSQWLEQEMAKLEKRIYQEAGEEFNIGSTQQLAKILFEKLRLPRGRKTRTGSSTDSDVLDQLSAAHRLPALVLEYRQLSKLKSTYADALPEMVAPGSNRLHTSFNQAATTTGRLSSSDPNLQNIPIRSEIGERIRKAFVATDPRNRLLTADYSQIELRILAHLSGDAALREAFAQDVDIHRFVAAQIHGVKPEEVTPAMRRVAKTTNFGIIYGQGPYGLARQLKIPNEEAAAFIEAYFHRYPGVKAFIDRTVADARKNGSVTTLLGRRRPLPGLNDPDHATRAFAERAAVNTVIQGTAADMIKVAMIRIARRLRDEKMRTKMLLQIHDELLFEVPPSEEISATDLVSTEMSTALKMDVPVKVNVALGRTWSEAK
ncbi:MAG: DNA polymerase I [Candidatus Brocadiia bacterium]